MARKKTRRRSTRTTPAPPSLPSPERGWEENLERYGFWVALGGLLLFLVVFFHPIFFGGKTFLPADEVASMAHRPYVAEAFDSSGSPLERYPLWTPYIFSGMPSFGSLIAAPYTNPMSFLLSPIPGVFKVVTYYLLLGIFSWLFLRRQGLGTLPALLGASAYIFCAHVVTLIMFGHNSKIATLVFLPLVLLATDELWKKPSVGWASLLALAVGTMLVTSHLQISYYTLLAAGIYLVVASVLSWRGRMNLRRVLGRWVIWGFGFVVGLTAGAVLYLPVREYAAYSIRGGPGGGLPYEYATNWSLHPVELATFFVPSFVGFGGVTYWGWMPFTDFPHYMGIVVLLLAAVTAVLWPRERLHLYLLILAGFSLILAFGKHLPLLYNLLFEYFPYFNKFRVPSMILFLFQFSVAMLAALGLARMLKTEPGQERSRVERVLWMTAGVVTVSVVVLGGAVAVGGMDGTIEERLAVRAGGFRLPPAQQSAFVAEQATRIADMVATDTVVRLLILVAGVTLVWTGLRRRIPAGAVVGGVLVLTLIDLWHVDHRPATYQERRTDPRVFEPTPAVRFLQQDPEPFRILPLTGQGRNNNWFAYFRIPSILGYHPAKLKIYEDLIDEEGPVGISKTLSRGNFNIVNMLNMKYLVADQEIEGGPLRTVHRGNQFVMENQTALPRMWFVNRFRVVSEPTGHLEALADPSWNPGDEALVFDDPGRIDPGEGGSAEITFYEPREIRATVTSPGNCLLVISEVFYNAGWNAWLDGEPVTIHRADYLLRAVRVPPGTHELRMRFDPPLFRVGVWLSVGAYGLIVLGLVGSGVRRWRGGAVPGPPRVEEPDRPGIETRSEQ